MYNKFVSTYLIILFFSCQWQLIGGRGQSPNQGVTLNPRYLLYQFKVYSNHVNYLGYSSSSTAPQQQPPSCSTEVEGAAAGGVSSRNG